MILKKFVRKKMLYKKSFKTLSVKLYEEAAKQAKLLVVQKVNGNNDKDDNVVDAEFEEVKDDKIKKWRMSLTLCHTARCSC